ncbi:MAG TPA: methionyl-tRNA formyltransferase [Saprospiraceae bacterium]|nr:methionyl-tRNA formyltransferase [Saprospiraceae bacterium]HNT21261.1 methionyl-tRNA formyltransferase [Saprospiraceae bacterium]
MRIVFMGTPAFAVPSLEALLCSHHRVVGVVTAPDSLGGRGGRQIIQSEVKTCAQAHKLHIMQPPKLKAPEFFEELKSLQADIQVVVAFRMLPEKIWSMPPLGTINVHGSLLPKYRGAAPIHWAVINGEEFTGVTVFRLRHEIDSGEILKQHAVPIGPDETTGDVYDKLKTAGAATLLEVLADMERGDSHPIPQDPSLVSLAPKLYHTDGILDFSKPRRELHNLIRGLSPTPTAWFVFNGLKFLLYRSHLPEVSPPAREAGNLQILGKKLYLHATDGAIEITEIQQENKKRMAAADFINGMKNHPMFN